ncbi:putative bacilysin exporter BacE [compost metagenome]
MEGLISGRVEGSLKKLLEIRNFRNLILTQLVSNLGDGVYRIALIWLMKVLTGDAFLISVLLAAETLPLILFGLFAGVLVDKGNKKRIMMITHLIRALLLGVLILLLGLGLLKPYMLIIIAVLLTCLTAFHKPAITVTIRTLVPDNLMIGAQSLSQIIQTIINLAAPALAALLIVFGLQIAFLFNVAAYLTGCIFIILIHHPKLENSEIDELTWKKVLLDLKEGVQAITRHPFLRNSMLYFTLINFVTAPETVLLPLIVSHVTELAGLEIGYCLGILLGSISVNYLTKFSPIVYICFGIGLFSFGIGVFAFNIPFVFQVLCVFINGIGSAFVNIKMSTMITLSVPQDVLGRASSLISVIVLCAVPVSTFLAGIISDYIPILMIFGIMGLLGFLIMICMFLNPHLKGSDSRVLALTSEESGKMTRDL